MPQWVPAFLGLLPGTRQHPHCMPSPHPLKVEARGLLQAHGPGSPFETQAA